MERQPLESLTGLVRIIGQAELPQPSRISWCLGELEVQVQSSAELNAWLAATQGDAHGVRESRIESVVVTSMPRWLDALPVRLSIVSIVNEQAWKMSLCSALSYEECVGWLVEWPTLDREQQRAAWVEMVDEHAMPRTLMPAAPETAGAAAVMTVKPETICRWCYQPTDRVCEDGITLECAECSGECDACIEAAS